MTPLKEKNSRALRKRFRYNAGKNKDAPLGALAEFFAKNSAKLSVIVKSRGFTMQQRRPVRPLCSVFLTKPVSSNSPRHFPTRCGAAVYRGHCPSVSRKRSPVTEVSDYTGFPEMMDGRVRPCIRKYMVAFWAVAARTMPYGRTSDPAYRYGGC